MEGGNEEEQDQRTDANGVAGSSGKKPPENQDPRSDGLGGSSRQKPPEKLTVHRPQRGRGIAQLEEQLAREKESPLYISPSYDGEIPGDLFGFKLYNNSRDCSNVPPGYIPIWYYPTPDVPPMRPNYTPSMPSFPMEPPSNQIFHGKPPLYPEKLIQPNVPTRPSHVPFVPSLPMEPPSNQINYSNNPFYYDEYSQRLAGTPHMYSGIDQPNSSFDPTLSDLNTFGDPTRMPLRIIGNLTSDSEPSSSKDMRGKSVIHRNFQTSEHRRDSELRELDPPSYSNPIPAPSPSKGTRGNSDVIGNFRTSEHRDSELSESGPPSRSNPIPAPSPSKGMRKNSAMNRSFRSSEHTDLELRELGSPSRSNLITVPSSSKDMRENSAMDGNTSEQNDAEELGPLPLSFTIPGPSSRQNTREKRAMNENLLISEQRDSESRKLDSNPVPYPDLSHLREDDATDRNFLTLSYPGTSSRRNTREKRAMNENLVMSEQIDSTSRKLGSNPVPYPNLSHLREDDATDRNFLTLLLPGTSSRENTREKRSMNENLLTSEQRDLTSRKLGSNPVPNPDLSHLREDDATDQNFLTLSLPGTSSRGNTREKRAMNENLVMSEQIDSKSRKLGSNPVPYPDLSHLRKDNATDRNFLTLSLPTNSNTDQTSCSSSSSHRRGSRLFGVNLTSNQGNVKGQNEQGESSQEKSNISSEVEDDRGSRLFGVNLTSNQGNVKGQNEQGESSQEKSNISFEAEDDRGLSHN